MLEKRKRLVYAQRAMSGIFNNQRVNASLAPILIGMLPSPAVVTVCGAIVKDAVGDSLPVEEKAFVTSYFRHICESFLPTYTGVIMGSSLSGIPLSSFLAGMLPMVFVLVSLGFVFNLRKVPIRTGLPPSEDKKKDALKILSNLWPIIFIVIMVMALNGRPSVGLLGMPFAAATIAIVASKLIDRFTWTELKPMFRSAFEPKLIFSTIMIMIFREILEYTGVIGILPSVFMDLPIPSFLIYAALFFFGTIISGQQAMVAIGIPLAFADPGVAGGMPLLVLLLSTSYAAMQISPTHVCLAVVTNYFNISMGALVRKTLPVILSFLVILSLYYLLLTTLGIH
jgi:integral membrane protein (TIGR00529 family)